MKTNTIYTTNNYSLFKPIDGNRLLNQLHLKRLKESIEKNYLFTVITVNERYEIIDGQHRFEAAKDLNIPVNYIICEGYGLDEVHILNQNSKIWNSDDYLTGYCDLGVKDYLQYKRFKDKFKFGHSECMAMLCGEIAGGGYLHNKFKLGEYKVTHWQQACEYGARIWSLKELYDGFLRKSFVYAMLELFEKAEFDFDEFISKVKLYPSALTNCSDKEHYIALIEEIYNYRRRSKVNLRY
jgi:hypothetical protein